MPISEARFSSPAQCNVYNSGQRRKLLTFKGFSRKVIVIVPNEEDWKKRLELRKEVEGEDVPESVMLEMKGRLFFTQTCTTGAQHC